MPVSEASLANLRPAWKRGDAPKAGRRSRDVDKALRLARKHTPDAILFAVGVLNDATEDTRYRLKAAEIILAAGLPKDPDAINKALGESDGLRYLEVVFVKPGEVIEHQPKPSGNGNGTFSVSFDAE
jgi:hypothetical protein